MKRLFLFSVAAISVCCNGLSVKEESFGNLSDGTPMHLITVTNASGASVSLSDYGARIVSINVPDKEGIMEDVIVGPGCIEDFENGDRFMGCILGRYANRIDNSSFQIDGKTYHVSANETLGGDPVHLSGGRNGFDRHVWDYDIIETDDMAGVVFHRMSPDGEEGYPGNCTCSVKYTWNNDNVLSIVYEASTDSPTIINLSNHAYFNLKGNEGGYIMDHILTVNADSCIRNNTHYCPDHVAHVAGSPFDFRTPQRIDYRIDMPDEHLKLMKGMSACWKLRDFRGNRADGSYGCIDSTARVFHAADLYDVTSGRLMEVWTSEPFLLTYTGRGFNGELEGKYGPIEKFAGMLMETIHAPDSPNQKCFPTTTVRPGDNYRTSTEFRFGIR